MEITNLRDRSVIVASCFIDDLTHPSSHTEQVGVETIFAVTVAALTPGDDANLVPAVVFWVLETRQGTTICILSVFS